MMEETFDILNSILIKHKDIHLPDDPLVTSCIDELLQGREFNKIHFLYGTLFLLALLEYYESVEEYENCQMILDYITNFNKASLLPIAVPTKIVNFVK